MFQSTRLHEARQNRNSGKIKSARFQSTRLHEARLTWTSSRTALQEFQSTRLHEARPYVVIIGSALPGFNPRACMRRDSESERSCSFLFLFQSTRLHEARLASLASCFFFFSFQSTRLHEARQEENSMVFNLVLVSIHAPA